MREYYVYLTNHCNLNCVYCDGQNLIRSSRGETEDAIDVTKVVQTIYSDLEKRPATEMTVVFFGGEPSMKPRVISELIAQIRRPKTRFVLHTNGTLLNSLDRKLFSKIHGIIVSIDGDKDTNDAYRGRGTYEIIMKNLDEIKQWYHGHVIARLTIVPNASLYRAVVSLAKAFDSVYWQLENSDVPIPNPSETLSSYRKNLDLLLDFWFDSLQHGSRIANVIPFQFAFNRLCFEDTEFHSPLCGAADASTVYIASSGDCYPCDKLVGKARFIIGSIHQGITVPKSAFFDVDQSSRCAKCAIKYLCGGRCMASHFLFPTSKMDYYCASVKAFWDACISRESTVEELIKCGLLNRTSLENPFLHSTECIP